MRWPAAWRPSLPWMVALATLAVHALIAVAYDFPGSFRKYPLAAELFLAGKLPVERMVDFSPLYFELNVLLVRCGVDTEAVLAIFQIVLAAGAAGFLAALLARRFSRGLTLAALVVFALDRHLLVYERVLEPESFLLFFVLGWFYFLERSQTFAPEDHARERRWLFWAGCCAATGLAARPTFLPVVALVPFFLWLRRRQGWLRRSVVFVAPVAAVLLLLAARAAVWVGDPRTPVMNPGTVFFEGNNPLSFGTSAVYPPIVHDLLRPDDTDPDVAHQHYRTVARAATGEALSIAQVNGYWSGLALGFLKSAPRHAASLLSAKLLLAFHGYRWHDIALASRYDRLLRVPTFPFVVLAALALLGLLFEARRWPAAFLFYTLAAAQLLVMLVFYVSARQRLVLLPALVYFAAVTVEWIARHRWRAWPVVGLVLFMALTLVLPNDQTRDDRYLHLHREAAEGARAALYEATHDEPLAAHVDLALAMAREAPWIDWLPAYFPQERESFESQLAKTLEAADEEGVSAQFDRGVAFLNAGWLDQAEATLGELAESGSSVYREAAEPSEPLYYLARIAARRGERPRAVELLEQALERSPGNPFVLADLLALSDEPRYQEELLRSWSRLDEQYLLGKALLFHGRAAPAAAALRFVVARLPELRAAHIYLAAALGESGHIDEGAQIYAEAVRSQPDPLLLSHEVSELFRRWAALHPGEAWVQLFAAHILREHGYFHDAQALLRKLAEPPPELRARWEEESRGLERDIAALGG